MFFQHKSKCPNCGKDVAANASYCGNCGFRLASDTRRCGACGAENRGDAQYCGRCGRSLDQAEQPEILAHRWARREQDFAVRIESADLKGFLKRGIKVEPGTNAMVIERGATRGTFPPGEYTLGTVGQRVRDWFTGDIPERVTVLLVSVTATDLEFNLGGRFTSDPLPIGLALRLQVEVEEPGKFLVNVLRGNERLSLDDIRQYLYPEVTAVADRWLRQHTLEQLTGDLSQLAQLELALEEALRTTFSQTGLRFLQMRTIELNLEPYEEITAKFAKANLMDRGLSGKLRLAEANLRDAESDIELQEQEIRRLGNARQRLADAKNETELNAARADLKALEEHEILRQEAALRMEALQKEVEFQRATLELDMRKKFDQLEAEKILLDLREDTRKVELEEQRADLYERMRQAVLNDKIHELRSKAEYETVLNQLDRQKLLSEKERADLLRAWEEQGEDHEKGRAHLLAKLQVERDYELRLAGIKLRGDELRAKGELDQQQLEIDIQLARRRTEGQLEIESARYEFDLKRRREQEAYQLNQQREQESYDFNQRVREADFQREQQQRRDQDAAALARQTLDLQKGAHDQELQEMLDDLKVAQAGFDVILHKREREKQIEWDDDRQRTEHAWAMQKDRQQAEWEREWQKIQVDLEWKQKQLDADLQRERDKMEFELSRLERLAQLGPEALISISGPEQARVLADLKKTEALKGMSDEQILAMAAKDSPDVARAFQEKYRAMADGRLGEQERQMYERLLADRQAKDEEIRRMQDEAIKQARQDADKRAQEVADAVMRASERGMESVDKTVDALKGVATAFADNKSGPSSPPIIITPQGSAAPPVIYTGGGAGVPAQPAGGAQPVPPATKNCPTCGRQVDADLHFCSYCGHKFEGV